MRLDGENTVSNETPRILLSERMLPPQMRVLHFDPDRLLRIRVPIPLPVRVLSLVFYLTVTALLSLVLSSIPVVTIFMYALVLTLWVLADRRGRVITINLVKPGYQLVSPVLWAELNHLPKVELKTIETKGRFTSTLWIAAYAAASVTSDDGRTSEKNFLEFVDAFAQPFAESATVVDEFSAPPQTSLAVPETWSAQTTTSDTIPLPIKNPLVILVHGTWGAKSSFAIPEKSALVKALYAKFNGDITFCRFPWSGANRSRDRAEAAKRLAAKIQTELGVCRRRIFVVAHSHGGNIAVRAFEALTGAQRDFVQNVLMATPFLSPGRRFDVNVVYDALPETIRSNLQAFCVMGFWIGSLFIFRLFRLPFFENGIPLSGELSLGQFPGLVFMLFSPFVLFLFLWKSAVAWLKQLPPINATMAQKSPFQNPLSFLVITDAQDEAFQALSVVVNLLSLVHQAFFLAILGMASLIKWSRIAEFAWSAFWLVFVVSLSLLFAGIASATLLVSIAAVWSSLKPFVDTLLALGTTMKTYLEPAANVSTALIFLFIFVSGLCIVAVMLSMFLGGLIRIGIFMLIGVLDQIRSRSDFINAMLGTVSISVIPPGRAVTRRLEDRTLFNHFSMKDDPQTIAIITELIEANAKV